VDECVVSSDVVRLRTTLLDSTHYFLGFNEIQMFSKEFRKILVHQISWKIRQALTSCSVRTEVRMDGRMDMNPVVAFGNL
jgi:hypothetical protein